MSIWTEPSPSDYDRWQERVLAGEAPWDAAKALGFGGSTTFKRANPGRHGEILQLWRDQQASDDRKTARDTLREIAENKEAPEPARVSAANSLGKASGYLTDRVEMTGADGGPVELAVKEARESLATRLAAIATRRGAGGGADEPQ